MGISKNIDFNSIQLIEHIMKDDIITNVNSDNSHSWLNSDKGCKGD